MKTQKCVCWRCEDVTNPLGSTNLLRLQEWDGDQNVLHVKVTIYAWAITQQVLISDC